MEWNRIETKWYEMARRLQHLKPQETVVPADAVSPAVEKPAKTTLGDTASLIVLPRAQMRAPI